MLKKDYILRLVEQAAKVLANALGLKEKGDYEKAMEELNYTYSELLKLSPNLILNKPTLDILNSFESDKIEQAEMLANCLVLEGEILKETGDLEKARIVLSKALECLHFVDKESGIFSFERQAQMVEIESILETL